MGMTNLGWENYLQTIKTTFEQEKSFIQMMEKASTGKNGATATNLAGMGGPGTLLLARAIMDNPECLEVLISDDIQWGREHVKMLSTAWSTMCDTRPEMAASFIDKLNSSGIDVIEVADALTLSMNGPGQAFLADIMTDPSASRRGRLHGALEAIVETIIADNIGSRSNTWNTGSLIDAYFAGVEEDREGMADQLMDIVMDVLSTQNDIHEKEALEVIGALVEQGARLNRERVVDYSQQDDQWSKITHPNLVHEAMWKSRYDTAWLMVELGGQWQACFEDSEISQESRELLGKHPAVRRSNLGEVAKQVGGEQPTPKTKNNIKM